MEVHVPVKGALERGRIVLGPYVICDSTAAAGNRGMARAGDGRGRECLGAVRRQAMAECARSGPGMRAKPGVARARKWGAWKGLREICEIGGHRGRIPGVTPFVAAQRSRDSLLDVENKA